MSLGDEQQRRLERRRAARDAIRRRRRIAAAGLLAAVAVVVALVLALSSGGSSPAAHPSAAKELAAASGGSRVARASGPTEAAERRALARLAALGRPIYCAGRKKPMVALTFDDGPGPYTHFVLKRLRRNHDRATFFLVSKLLPAYGSLVPKEQAFGVVEDHTETHPNLVALGAAQQEAEIGGAQTAIAKLARRPVQLFRPPYGERDASVDEVAKRHGLVEVLWTVDSQDSLGANYAGIFKNVVAGLKPGNIILMHDNRGQTVRALPPILHALHNRHLRAVTLPELLTADPPSAGQLRAGRHGCGLSGATQLGTGPAGG